jgi:hypothetical protein
LQNILKEAAVTINEETWEGVIAEDLARIRQAALDYIEAWYSGDAVRMESVLHPDLVKRTIMHDPRGFDRLEPISALGLVIAARRGTGTRTQHVDQRKEVTILDISGSMAAVKVVSADFIDYLHIGKLNGVWQIVNVLWERTRSQA